MYVYIYTYIYLRAARRILDCLGLARAYMLNTRRNKIRYSIQIRVKRGNPNKIMYSIPV